MAVPLCMIDFEPTGAAAREQFVAVTLEEADAFERDAEFVLRTCANGAA